MDFDLDIVAAAADRWAARAPARAATLQAIADGHATTAETPERLRRRLDRLTAVATRERAARTSFAAREALLGGPSTASVLVDTVGFERVIGRADFLGTEFLELALAVARFVGRINVRSAPRRTEGYGTGFMVSPRLLLTNNHVLRTRDAARHTEIEFDFQNDRFGRLLPVVTYRLEPEVFFLADEHLDYTLVAVSALSADGRVELKRYGWSRLIPDLGKVLLGDPLNIIQHPRGQPKQIVLRANQLVDLPDAPYDMFAHYITDTEPGSSGSPVYNDQWEVVALHHSGIARRDAAGNYLTRDGAVWRQGMDPDDLDWVANEGVRISRIVDHIRKSQLTPAESLLRSELLDLEPPHPLEAAALSVAAERPPVSRPRSHRDVSPTAPVASDPETHTFVLPLKIAVTVSVGDTSSSPEAAGRAATPVDAPTADSSVAAAAGARGAPAAAEGLKEPIVDRDYETRSGYDSDFLGGGLSVPFPTVDEAVVARLADETSYTLPYEHFSIVMHEQRRLALCTAANVSGAHTLRRPEPGNYTRDGLGGLDDNDSEKWVTDPRIPLSAQLPDRFFTRDRKAFDKGHIVRREDVCFGTSYAQVRRANGDTFHVTNCSPQVSYFNRAPGDWGRLENHILSQVTAEGDRYCVFAGPVLDPSDPRFEGVDDVGPVEVQIPTRYWKVVAASVNGALHAWAFVLEQDLSTVPMTAEFDPDPEWEEYLVSLVELQELVRAIKFPDTLLAADQAATPETEAMREATGTPRWARGASAAKRRTTRKRMRRRAPSAREATRETINAGGSIMDADSTQPLERYPNSSTRKYVPAEVTLQVKRIIAYLTKQRWPVVAIGDDTSFDMEIGWDKIAMTDLRQLCERVFGVPVSPKGMLSAKAVADAVKIVTDALISVGRVV